MSLFGLMGDLDDDPFMGGHVRRMNSLMNSFFRDPFVDMFGGGSGRGGMLGIGGPAGLGGDLMPFTGGRNIQSPAAMMLSGGFPSILDMGNAGNGSHVSAMSTVMTMTQGPDGRPQVYQASQSVRQGPGGIRETKKTVADSRTGVKKMSIGRHVYDRGHVIEREQNVYSGEREENEEFINLDEDEADNFNKEWETRARQMMPGRNAQAAIGYGNSSGSHRRRHHGASPQLALPSTTTNPPQPPQRFVGRSSRRSTYGLTHLHQQQPSTASTIAASTEEGEGDNEEEPPKKRIKANLTVDEGDKINISFQHQEEEEESDEEEDDVVEDDEDDDDDDEVEEVIDSDSEQVLNNTNTKVKNL